MARKIEQFEKSELKLQYSIEGRETTAFGLSYQEVRQIESLKNKDSSVLGISQDMLPPARPCTQRRFALFQDLS